MKLDGIHHVTCITGDIRKNVDFYTRVLGLRLVAKSVNQDDPFVYHVFYSDEEGHPGSDITFFEYPGTPRGRAGAGMIHRILWRVGSPEAMAFWQKRLTAEAVPARREEKSVLFADPEGLEHELVVSDRDESLTAEHPEIPRELALRGFDGVRAYAREPERTRTLLEKVMSASRLGDAQWEVRSSRRGSTFAFDPPPGPRGLQAAGTVHHVAWGTTMAEHPRWVEHLRAGGMDSTPVIDRHYFHSIYFREPNGVLFEIADDGPGFARDGNLEELGKKVILPPWFESRRAEIEASLTPIPDPRASWKGTPKSERAHRIHRWSQIRPPRAAWTGAPRS
jgi:glyoxalase family protein